MLLLSAIVASALATDDFRVEMCRHPLIVDVEASEPLFMGKHRETFDSCGSGVPHEIGEAGRKDPTVRFSIQSDDGKYVRLVLEDVRREIQVVRSRIEVGQSVELETNESDKKLRARFAVSAATFRNVTVTLHVVNQPVDALAARLQAISGWKFRGLEHVGDRSASFRMDAVPLRIVLYLIADVAKVTARIDNEGEAVFEPRR